MVQQAHCLRGVGDTAARAYLECVIMSTTLQKHRDDWPHALQPTAHERLESGSKALLMARQRRPHGTLSLLLPCRLTRTVDIAPRGCGRRMLSTLRTEQRCGLALVYTMWLMNMNNTRAAM